MVVIDLVILTIYTVVEGLSGNLEAKRIPDKENSIEEVGVSELINSALLTNKQSIMWAFLPWRQSRHLPPLKPLPVV